MSVDLSTYYLGMKLKNPFGVAACPPLTGDLEMLRRLEEAGASVAVMPSLFGEQIEHEELEFNRLLQRCRREFESNRIMSVPDISCMEISGKKVEALLAPPRTFGNSNRKEIQCGICA